MTSIRVLLVVAAVAAASSGAAAERLVWFGCGSGTAASPAGIHVARFDPETGAVSEPELAIAVGGASFLAVHPQLPMLYAVAEQGGADGAPAGAIRAFRIDPATGRLAAVNHRPSGGAGPCHVSVDPSGEVVLAANYSGGNEICLGVAADGGLEPATADGVLGHTRADDPAAKPLAHSIDACPDGRFAIACDKGLDRVFIHELDVPRATLREHAATTIAAGSGPRHSAMHPGGRFAYVVNERGMTVTALAYDPRAGTLTPLQTLSTLPDGVQGKGLSTAEIAVHPSGRFLYASNRGHDSIAVFAVDEATGRLTFRGAEPIRGKTPRHFAIAPGGRFLLAAGQNSSTVTVFAIDPSTGALEFTGRTVAVPAPACITFAPDTTAAAR
jgi:6-phosphogluconolactonase